MKLSKTVVIVVTAWVVTISALHSWLNLEASRALDGGPSFRVGFLPVT
jgi:hypothetical protein